MVDLKRILVATDGSENAQRAVEYAAQLARWSGAELVIANVLEERYFLGHLVGLAGDVRPNIKWLGDGTPHIETDSVDWGLVWEEVAMEDKISLEDDYTVKGLAVHQVAELKRELQLVGQSIGDDVKLRLMFKVGSPKKDLLLLAKEVDADTIVMGCRGLSSFGNMILGSISSYVLQHATVPVLMVK